jgi:hypothetical protein
VPDVDEKRAKTFWLFGRTRRIDRNGLWPAATLRAPSLRDRVSIAAQLIEPAAVLIDTRSYQIQKTPLSRGFLYLVGPGGWPICVVASDANALRASPLCCDGPNAPEVAFVEPSSSHRNLILQTKNPRRWRGFHVW